MTLTRIPLGFLGPSTYTVEEPTAILEVRSKARSKILENKFYSLAEDLSSLTFPFKQMKENYDKFRTARKVKVTSCALIGVHWYVEHLDVGTSALRSILQPMRTTGQFRGYIMYHGMDNSARYLGKKVRKKNFK